MNFPATMPVADMLVTHPDYDPEQIADHNHFYEGGRNFPLDLYLRKKPIETASAPSGGYHQGGAIGDMRAVRVNSAYYGNHFAGVVNELLSAIVFDPPQFASPTNDAYWDNVNDDADGLGGPIALQVMQSLRSRMMYNRSYYQIVFAPTPGNATRDLQEKTGGLRARLIQISGDLVDDWGYDSAGKLLYIRKHVKSKERADPDAAAGARSVEKHDWIYHTPEGIFTYSASIDLSKATDFASDAVALRDDGKENKSGVFQIIEVRCALDFFVGDALYPVAKQIFNAASDSSYARFTSATCTPVLASEKEPDEVLRLGPFNLLNVGPNGSLKFATAPAEFFSALDAAEEKHKAELYMQVHSMAAATKAAAASGQNVSRESGTAITAKAAPLHAFLQAFAAGEISALNQAAAIIQKVRNNPEAVTLTGLMEYDTDDLDTNIARAQVLALVPQTPKPIMEMLLRTIGLAMADDFDADSATRETIRTAKLEEATPPPAVLPGGEPGPPPPPATQPATPQLDGILGRVQRIAKGGTI